MQVRLPAGAGDCISLVDCLQLMAKAAEEHLADFIAAEGPLRLALAGARASRGFLFGKL